MNTYIKKLFEIIDFNTSDIFNKEESYYNNSKIIDNYTYKNILEKLKNAELVSEEEYEYAYQYKYKVSSKEELKAIVDIYSKKNPTGSLNWIDTSLITDMSQLFEGTKYNGDISEWDTSNVTNMYGMFYKAILFNQPIGNWDVSKVEDMKWMFAYAKAFNQSISDWDVSNVIDMYHMFFYAKTFNQDISKWKLNDEVNIYKMFDLCNINDIYKPIK